MRVLETISSLVRRWYIMLFGLLLTAGMCWAVQERVPVTYEAKGSQVLMPPSATVGAEGNPYLYLGGMSQALDVLIRHVTAAEVTKPVLDAFPDTKYSVQADRSTSGSILVVSASGSTPEATLGVLHSALDKIPVALKGMQDELAIADKFRIDVRTVVVDSQATKDDQSQMRMMMLAAAAGIVGTVLLTAMVDGFLSGRKKARHTDGEPGGITASEDPAGKDRGQATHEVVREDPGPPMPRSNAMRQRSRARSGASS
jgi:hypothetical protein